MDQDNQIIKEYYEAIDTKLQQLLLSPETKNKISQITQKYPLSEEQGAQLKNEIYFVLLGMEVLSGFRASLVNELGITYDQALKLSFSVNEEIFSTVMNELKEMESEVIEAGLVKEGEEQDEEKNEAPRIVMPASASYSVSKPTPAEPPKNLPTNSNVNILQKQSMASAAAGAPAGAPRRDRMIPDHSAMEITDGPHLHSQSVMPSAGGESMGSIIDQKLSNIFRGGSVKSSNSGEKDPRRSPIQIPKEVADKRNEKYRSSDPYRESIN